MNLNAFKKLTGGLALAGAIALTGVVGFAQTGQNQNEKPRGERGWGGREGRGHKGGGNMGNRFAELNLTDAQKAQMEQIQERFRQQTQSLREQGRGERGGDFDAFGGGTFNESAVRAAAQARANRQVEMEVAHARMMFEMYNVLTPEQKSQLEADRQQRRQRRQEFRNQRNNQNPGQIQ
ncbi:MAG TPA: Spy/CpxP family protein refolding chaperone [Pyrinomonadaceae bacterium]|jgi:protein CpxP|nr:Spy/CpxP family protein refolding chaperone [Pyrinomonadaceae bacterium]